MGIWKKIINLYKSNYIFINLMEYNIKKKCLKMD